MYAIGSNVKISLFKRNKEHEAKRQELMKTDSVAAHDVYPEDLIEHYDIDNMIMERMIDRFVSLFTHDDTTVFFVTGGGTIYNKYTCQLMLDHLFMGGMALVSGAYGYNNIPELIGVGDDNTTPTPQDRGLYNPYAGWYMNTWNSKEGGSGFANRDYNSFRCGALWDTSFVGDVNELGLFVPQTYLSLRSWDTVGVPDTIDFTRGGAGNRAWSILNIYDQQTWPAGPDVAFWIAGYDRDDNGSLVSLTYSWSRATQFITYTGPAALGPTAKGALSAVKIAFTPDVNHAADIAGSSLAFVAPPNNADLVNLPQLYARVALPSTLAKTADNTMAVTWLIYIKEIPPTL